VLSLEENVLHRLEELASDIRVAIIGIGSIGRGMVLQCQLTPAIECVAIADIRLERAIACAQWLGRDYEVVETLPALHSAIHQGKLAVCEDGQLLAQCDLADVLIESTNAIAAGGQFAITALEHGKHLIMMNAEADLLFGPYLLHLARQNGVVYSSADGDQPVVIRRLIDELQFWGFELVMAGNIKGYLDRYANPATIIPEADKRSLDYRMCTSYTDGTKLCVEMALLANAFGLRAAVPGMHGPRAVDVHDVFDLFDFEELWKDRQPLVDYLLGAKPTGGVFAIGYTENEFQQYTLDWFPPDMGPGPFYLFYRPYHLGHFESLSTVFEAVLDGHSLLQPECGFRTNVYAYAKRDLRQGEQLDGIGGYACYGLIDNCVQDDAHPGLPICLAGEVTLTRDLRKDEKIALDDVVHDPGRFDYALHAKAVEYSGQGPR
jgi:predicted homoserine dehydrogenase-like protein